MLLVAGAPAWAEGQVEEIRPLKPGGTVTVENLAGSVRVQGWDRDEVKVLADLGRGTERLAVDSDPDSVEIEVVLESGRHRQVEGSDLEIWVPRRIELGVETVSAAIELEGLTGSAEIESVSGRIRVSGDLEELSIEAVSGLVEVESSRSLEDLSIETVSGEASVEGDFHPSGDYEMETVSGFLDLAIPRGFCADFDVETFSGKIENEVGPEARKTSEYLPSKELSFSTCSGDARFSLSSFSGKVRIRER
jgi:hypothetical protein